MKWLIAVLAMIAALEVGAQTAIEQYDTDNVSIERAKSILQAPPPAANDRRALIKYHFDRSDAARRLGDTQQQVAELRKAHEIAGGMDPRVVDNLASAEHLLGNRDTSTRLREEILNRQLSPSWRFTHTAVLAGYYSEIADFDRASKTLASAEQIFGEFPRTIDYGSARALFHWQRSRLLRAQGQLSDAEAAGRIALEERKAHQEWMGGKVSDQSRYALGLQETHYAGVLRAQGKLAQTEWLLRETLERTIKETSRESAPTARVALNLVGVMVSQGRYSEALGLARSSLAILEARGAKSSGYNISGALLQMGRLHVLLGDYSDALGYFTRRMQALNADPANVRAGAGGGSVFWGRALIRLGRPAEAVDMLRTLSRNHVRRSGEKSYITLESRGFLACALYHAGQTEQAAQEFGSVVPALISARQRQRAQDRADVTRDTLLNWILEGYMELLAARAEAGGAGAADAAAEAFRIADVSRGSNVQRAVVLSSSRAAIRDPDLAQLVRKEQDLGNRQTALAEIVQNLLSRRREQQPEKIIADIRREIEAMTKEREAIREDIASRFPNYTRLLEPKPATVYDVQKILRPGEVLLSTYTTHDRTFVWAIAPTGEPRFAQVALGEAELARSVRRLRSALDVGDVTHALFPAFDTGLAYSIYEKVLQPVEAVWQDAQTLIVVPHGALGQLSFALLPTKSVRAVHSATFDGYREVPWLVRKLALVQVPSVNALAALRASRSDDTTRKAFVGFGDPLFSAAQAADASRPRGNLGLRNLGVAAAGDQAKPMTASDLRQLPRLPDTAEEIKEIAAILKAGASDVFLGKEASESNVKRIDLANRRIIVFATHGLVPGDLNGLTQPALALSNPEVTGEKDADGLLTMEEILGLKLNADWVVLSACNTAAADGAGSEAVSGMGRAFFYAGARALLVSNWPVETVSARLLTTDLFKRQAENPNLTRAEALRQTMLGLMDGQGQRDAAGKLQFSYAHPMFWAPFSLVGDGAGR